jgi:tetratricopeptide (TPR) repeat protein
MSRRNVFLFLGFLTVGSPSVGAQDRVANAYDAYRTGQYDVAVSVLSDVMLSRPSPAAALLLGRVLIETGRYQEAEELLRKNDSTDDAGLEVATLLGEVLLATGQLDQAMQQFRRVTESGAAGPLLAHLRIAEIDIQMGERRMGTDRLNWIVAQYNGGQVRSSADLSSVATALEHLGRTDPGRFREALRVYDQAIAADSTNLDAQVAAGDLFLSKYEGPDARAMYQLALSRNSEHPAAVLGLAQARRFDGASEAFDLTERSLAANPNFVRAHVLEARQYLDLEAYPKADDAAQSALETNPRDPMAHTMLAASALLSGDYGEFAQLLQAARATAPHDPEIFVALAEVAARNRLYHQAAIFGDSAITLDSLSWRGYALRGINRLRTGDIAAGREDLEIAFAGDPFDLWTMNTLDLMDEVSQYMVVVSDRFELAIPAEEADLLALYMMPLAEAAWDSLSAHYGVSPAVPQRLEVFPRHTDFSVRTIGLPGMGALGVSFGPVIALDAPSARPPGSFHWGTTLWHELAHSFHMEASGYRVPRWFTEGLAVFEERRSRPGWGDRIQPDFLIAYLEERLAPVEDLNQGFMRPAYPRQVIFSYYQSSLVFDFITERWGFPAIVTMLHAYGEGKNTPEIFETVLSLSLPAFAEAYDEYFSARFAGPLAAMKLPGEGERPTMETMVRRAEKDSTDFLALLATGAGLMGAHPDSSLPYLERAKALFPEYAGDNSPYFLLATAHHLAGRSGKVAVELEELTSRNQAHYPGLRLLAEARLDLADTSGAARALESAQYVYPFETADHLRLAQWYSATGQQERAIQERRAVLALNPFNRSEALYQLALAQWTAGDQRGARSTVLEALEQAPNYEEALELLLEMRGER